MFICSWVICYEDLFIYFDVFGYKWKILVVGVGVCDDEGYI